MTSSAKHPLDVDLDIEPEEFARLVDELSRPPCIIPKLAAALRRHRDVFRRFRCGGRP